MSKCEPGCSCGRHSRFPPAEERFWSHVDRSGDCWLWTGRVNRDGYGQFDVFNTSVLAHRYGYELQVGAIPNGMELDHRFTCPKRCVRGIHLRPTTHKQNLENRPGAYANSTTGIRGVYLVRGRYRATTANNGKSVHVGYFDTPREAENAVIAKRNELHTHNDIDRLKETH